MSFIESYKQKGLRKKMVDELRKKGHFSESVLEAMGRVPRHLFLPNSNAFDVLLYEDRAFRIAGGQTISHPSTVAWQSTLLDIQPMEKVLEIGTGSGYQAAVLCELGARVYTIERQKVLFDNTPTLLRTLGYSKIKTFFGDGFAGVAAFAPYSKIIITCAAPEIPQALIDQLLPGGYIVIPLTNEDDNQTMIRIHKTLQNELIKEEYGVFSFVPMLKGKSFDTK